MARRTALSRPEGIPGFNGFMAHSKQAYHLHGRHEDEIDGAETCDTVERVAQGDSAHGGQGPAVDDAGYQHPYQIQKESEHEIPGLDGGRHLGNAYLCHGFPPSPARLGKIIPSCRTGLLILILKAVILREFGGADALDGREGVAHKPGNLVLLHVRVGLLQVIKDNRNSRRCNFRELTNRFCKYG